MSILIFDSYGGLCNQFMDINSALNFCINNNIMFSFRYASLRNSDLTSWINTNIDNLFDTKFFETFSLYIPFEKIEFELNENNTFNLNGETAINILSKDITITEIININKKFIIFKQFWAIYDHKQPTNNYYKHLLPCNLLLNKYKEIKSNLKIEDDKYNFLHYRYESDFLRHFHINNLPTLEQLIINNNYSNKELSLYISCSDVNKLVNELTIDKSNIIFKNEDELFDLNFEQKAFIDFMFGKNSFQVFGHTNSSFSVILNNLKNTCNFFNL